MNILVTGSAGSIGSKLCEKLEGYVGIDRKDGKDLLDCDLPAGIDLIYHLAAETSVVQSWEDPLAYSYNFTITVRLAERYPKAKIIFVSTVLALSPRSPYAFSKKESGDYLKEFHPNTVICFLPNIFGIGRGVADAFRGKEEVVICGDGCQKRSFVHVDDAVRGLLKAKEWPRGEYFLGTGVGVSILDLARGKKIRHEPARRGEDPESVLPNTTPDWKPTVDVIDYVKAG